MKTNKTLNVGIIGTGKHGSRYANHIVHDLKKYFKLTAISRRSQDIAQSQAKKWNCIAHQDFHDLIANPLIDAVISATTPNLNFEIGQTCLKYNKPLLIEKPLDTNVIKAQELVDLFKKANLGLTIGQTLRYNSIINALKENITTIGDISSLCATHRLEPSTLGWLTDPNVAGGGVLFHTAVHLFDALRYITDKEVVRVRTSTFNKINPNLEDLFVGQIEMEDGLVGIVEACKVGAARSGRYEFVGEHGHLQGDQVHGVIELCSPDGIKPIPYTTLEPTIKLLLKDWALFLLGSQPNPIAGTEGLAAVKICDACRVSAQKDQWVKL